MKILIGYFPEYDRVWSRVDRVVMVSLHQLEPALDLEHSGVASRICHKQHRGTVLGLVEQCPILLRVVIDAGTRLTPVLHHQVVQEQLIGLGEVAIGVSRQSLGGSREGCRASLSPSGGCCRRTDR